MGWKHASFVVPVLAVMTALAAADPAPLVVISDFANPPFSSWNEGAPEPEGLEPDLMRELAARAGRPIRWSRRPFTGLLAAVAAHDGDVVAATVGITAERAKRVAFTRPYHDTRIAVVVREGAEEPRSLAGLAGLHVGAGRGTTSEDAVRRELPHAVPVLDREDDRTFEHLLVERAIAAVVMDAPAADRLVGEHPGLLRRLEQDLGAERYAFAVARDRPELLAAIEGLLADLEASGRLAALKRRHGLTPASPD
jgi:polar amino acid transport system substrate-binding protein